VEDDALIEALVGEKHEVVHRLGRSIGIECDRDRPVIGVEKSGVTLGEVDGKVRLLRILIRHGKTLRELAGFGDSENAICDPLSPRSAMGGQGFSDAD